MGAEEGILYADCDLEIGIQMKLRHDFAGHYNRPDIFHLHINRAAPRLYSVHDETAGAAGGEDRPRWSGPGAILAGMSPATTRLDFGQFAGHSMSSGVTTTDTRVTSAIHHWAPRFVAQGVCSPTSRTSPRR